MSFLGGICGKILFMWFWLLVIGGFFKSVHKLLERVILREEKESISLAFFLQASSIPIVLPLFLLGLKFSQEAFLPYFVLLVVAVIDTLAVFLIRESIRLLEISLREIIYQIRIFFVLILSALFLNESLNFLKVFGSSLIFLGIVMAVFKRRKIGWFREKLVKIFKRKEQKSTGIFLTLAAALVTAFELMGWKYLFGYFTVPFTLFCISLISTFLFLIVVPNLTKRVLNLVKGEKGKLVLLDGFLGNVSWILFFWATSMTEASKTLPIDQAFMFLAVLGGIIFLGEKERIWQKVLGGILAGIGVVLVKGS